MPEKRFDEIDHGLDRLTANEAAAVRSGEGVIDKGDSLRLEMRAGFAMIMKRLDDHTVPGDAADRAFAAVSNSA